MDNSVTHPSKILKYCPFCGSKNFHWDGVKYHCCADCGKQFYTNAAGAVIALIVNQKGEYLFTTRRLNPQKGKLDLPGGFIDMEETAEQAVVREVKEELNLEVETLQFCCSLPNQYVYNGLTYFTIDLVFRCQVKNLLSLSAMDDVDSAKFLSLDKVNIDEVGLHSVKVLVNKLKNNEL